MLSSIEIMKIEYEKSNSRVHAIPVSYQRREMEKRFPQLENSSRSSNIQQNVEVSSAVNAYTKVLTRGREYSKKD